VDEQHLDTQVDRRTVLGAAVGLGAVMTLGAGGAAQAAELTDTEKANVKLVGDFCAAWATRDFAKILPFLAEDSSYRMSETTPAVAGHAGVRERLGSWLESSQQIEFKILDTYAKGPMVVNHRVDRFVSSTRPLTWEGVGVFFVKDGKIKEWFDYTIRVQRPPA
jgi:limonene-1,2-epoxide hydrolase